MALENNIPAFPRTMSENSAYEQDGMTLLDYFAAKALQGLMSNIPKEFISIKNLNQHFAIISYEQAAIMLEERKKYIK